MALNYQSSKLQWVARHTVWKRTFFILFCLIHVAAIFAFGHFKTKLNRKSASCNVQKMIRINHMLYLALIGGSKLFTLLPWTACPAAAALARWLAVVRLQTSVQLTHTHCLAVSVSASVHMCVPYHMSPCHTECLACRPMQEPRVIWWTHPAMIVLVPVWKSDSVYNLELELRWRLPCISLHIRVMLI